MSIFEYHMTRRVCDVTLVTKAGLCHFVTGTIYAYGGPFLWVLVKPGGEREREREIAW